MSSMYDKLSKSKRPDKMVQTTASGSTFAEKVCKSTVASERKAFLSTEALDVGAAADAAGTGGVCA